MPDPGQLVGPDTLIRPQDLPFPQDGGTAGPPYPSQPAPPAAPSNLSADQAGPSPYTQYLIDVRFDLNSGLRQNPAAGADGASCVFPKVTAAWQTKTVTWTAERLGDWPTVPYWDTGNGNEVFLEGHFTLCNPLDGPNGVRVYRAAGQYVFGLLVPLSATQDVPVCASPLNTDGTVSFPAVKFDRGVLRSA